MTIPLLPGDPHDEALRRLVKPPDWVNPTPAARYQLVVLGGGPAGLVCAAGAAGLGAKVSLVERDLLGGDCLNVGCVPSKTLLRAAKAAAEVRRARQFGVNVPEPEIDFPAVMERVRRVRAELAPTDSAERFRSLGIDVFLGEGKFVNEDTVEVNGAKLRFGRCIIATGSRPLIPDIPGLAESRWFTNETIFTLTELPKRLLVIGGGPIGCELGQAFARLGSKVTIVTRGRLLPHEEEDAARVVETALRRDGVEIAAGTVSPPAFDAVLVAAGRWANVEKLNLGAGRVWFGEDGVRVDAYLRTSNRRVFAAGDICRLGYRFTHGRKVSEYGMRLSFYMTGIRPSYQFTHAADAMARLAIRNALFPRKARVSAHTIPWCTYTDPEVGRIGLNEQEANESGYPVDVFRHEFPQLDRGATDGAEGFIKVLTKKGTDRIVGATVVGPCAGELVSSISVAMTNGIGLKQLANTVFPYPTYTEAIKKVADLYNRTRLTPRAKWLLGKWLKWFR